MLETYQGANHFFARTHFLACEGVAGGSQQSGGNSFSRNTVARSVGPSCQGGNIFFAKYGGPSGGSLLSGGGIIIFRIIRRHFLVAAVDLAVNLSTYSILPMEFGR